MRNGNLTMREKFKSMPTSRLPNEMIADFELGVIGAEIDEIKKTQNDYAETLSQYPINGGDVIYDSQ